MKKPIIFLFLILLVIPLATAINIRTGTILNTTSSNSSVTFSINKTPDRIEITPISVYIVNVTGKFAQTCNINHTAANTNLDSADFDCMDHGAGGEGAGVAEEEVEPAKEILKKVGKEVELKNIIVKSIIWLLISMIFITISFIMDMMRRDKKISLYIELTILIIFALALFISGWIIQDIVLGQPIQITLGIIIIIWAIAVIILLIVAYVTDVARRKKKINVFTQLLAVVLVAIALFISGWIIQDVLKGQPIEINLAIGILTGIAVLLLIMAIIIEVKRRKTSLY